MFTVDVVEINFIIIIFIYKNVPLIINDWVMWIYYPNYKVLANPEQIIKIYVQIKLLHFKHTFY